MYNYINNSSSVKTFYGVEFKPGEVHSVPGYINSKGMCRVAEQPLQKPSGDVIEDIKPEVVSDDLASEILETPETKEEIEVIHQPRKQGKKGKGKKSKNTISLIIEEESEETIENIIEEGEETNG